MLVGNLIAAFLLGFAASMKELLVSKKNRADVSGSKEEAVFQPTGGLTVLQRTSKFRSLFGVVVA